MNVPSLASMAEATVLGNLKDSLQANNRTATFACGGHVQICQEKDPQQLLAGGSSPPSIYSNTAGEG